MVNHSIDRRPLKMVRFTSSPVFGGTILFRGCLVWIVYTTLQPYHPLVEGAPNELENNEAAAVAYLEELEPSYSAACTELAESRWSHSTNINEENEKASVQATTDYLDYQAGVQRMIQQKFPQWNTFSDPVQREFKNMATGGPGNMSAESVKEMTALQAKIESAFATAKVCEYPGEGKKVAPDCVKNIPLRPNIWTVFEKSQDYSELEYYWNAWYDELNKAISTSTYKRFVDLQNEQARANGFLNTRDMWVSPYNDGSGNFSTKEFTKTMLETWETLRPYYNKIHAYVRMKLKKYQNLYPKSHQKEGYIPVNILGDLWAQDWTALDNITKPYPDVPPLDATEAMIKQNYTVLKMFQVADEFFQGLGLLKMTDTFWNKSQLTKPDDRPVACHPTAEDFCGGRGSTDFRVKMCTEVTQYNLITVHHEMGHIEYYMQYRDQRISFRDGANPGFHEAIGDTLAMAVSTPKHLQCKLGLDLGVVDCNEQTSKAKSKSKSDQPESENHQKSKISQVDINFLYFQALQKLVGIPFKISLENWRWSVFDGTFQESEYNEKWWEIIRKNQGIVPPTDRNREDLKDGLDAGAKYHIPANIPFLRYFFSTIVQYQFYEALCIEAGEYDPDSKDPDAQPLFQCDFSGNKKAGEKLGKMMRLGSKEYWSTALEVVTGSRELSTKSLLHYFKPLFDYVDAELQKNGEVPGFGKDYQGNQ